MLTTATAVLTSAPRPDARETEVAFTLDLRPRLARERAIDRLPPPPTPSNLRQEIPPQEESPEFVLELPANEALLFDDAVRLAPQAEATSTRRTQALSTAIGTSVVGSGKSARRSRAGFGRPDGSATSPSPLLSAVPVAADEPPVAIETPQPAYPDSARRRGDQGVVLCRLFVTEAGSVGAVEVTGSSGHPTLDAAACACLKRWKFRPAAHGGQAYSCTLEQRVTFQLR